jgi:hypothetical protein
VINPLLLNDSPAGTVPRWCFRLACRSIAFHSTPPGQPKERMASHRPGPPALRPDGVLSLSMWSFAGQKRRLPGLAGLVAAPGVAPTHGEAPLRRQSRAFATLPRRMPPCHACAGGNVVRPCPRVLYGCDSKSVFPDIATLPVPGTSLRFTFCRSATRSPVQRGAGPGSAPAQGRIRVLHDPPPTAGRNAPSTAVSPIWRLRLRPSI